MKKAIPSLTFLLFKPFIQTKYKEIPIKRKRIVQTGPNTTLGGLKTGLFKVLYQLDIAGIVMMEPINPTNCGITIDTINIKILFTSFSVDGNYLFYNCNFIILILHSSFLPQSFLNNKTI